MSGSPKPLYDLLRALFRSNDDLLALLQNYGYAGMDNLIDALPAPTVSRTRFINDAVQQMRAHGLDQPRFFDTLVDQFPGRTDLIKAGKADYFSETAVRPD